MNNFATTRLVLGLVALAVLGFGVASAVGAVTVYNNDFSSRGEFRDIKKSGGGKRCVRYWRM